MDTEPSIHSVDEARKYREELAARQPEQDPVVVRWRIWERFTLLILLVAAFGIFYVISITIEILSLPSINVPASTTTHGPTNSRDAEKRDGEKRDAEKPPQR